MKIKLFLVVFVLVLGSICFANSLEEHFDDLDLWEPLFFEKIPAHSSYNVVLDVDANVLEAVTSASASGLIYSEVFDVYKNADLEWSWKISNVFKKGNATKKEGDDYPIRVYIIFEYNPDKSDFFERIQYEAAKAFYGEYPPHSSLNYIWANKSHDKQIMNSPYTDKSKIVIKQSGADNVNKWMFNRVNVLDDYREAFKTDPPSRFKIAVMSDSDNTGESAKAYIDYIRIKK